MTCSLKRLTVATFVAALMSLSTICGALTLLAPTNGQTVRESVSFVFPEGDIPEKGFLSLFISSGDKVNYDNFVGALDRHQAQVKDHRITFKWNSKEPFRREANEKLDLYWLDGTYTIEVQVHDREREGKLVGSATVKVALRNKVARSVPAPAVRLVNNLPMGQSNNFSVMASVQAYDSTELPILGNLGLSALCELNQSVEDIWPDGSRLVHYRVGKKAEVYTFGTKSELYPSDYGRPQLYRLIGIHGNVVNDNVFARQRGTSLSGVLPVLPTRAVKEGDSWPDKLSLKVEGVTAKPIVLTGTAVLDSFEWEGGEQCAKITSNLSGDADVSLLNGQISSSSEKIKAKSVTWFAYKRGKLLRRYLTMEFPADISPGIGTGGGFGAVGTQGSYGSEAGGGPGGVIPGAGRFPGSIPGMPGMPGGMGPGGMGPGGMGPGGMGPGGMGPGGMGPGGMCPGAVAPPMPGGGMGPLAGMGPGGMGPGGMGPGGMGPGGMGPGGMGPGGMGPGGMGPGGMGPGGMGPGGMSGSTGMAGPGMSAMSSVIKGTVQVRATIILEK